MNKSEVFQKWWPLPRHLDLVHAPAEVVAKAVHSQVKRWSGREILEGKWLGFKSIDKLFESVDLFTNVPTLYFVLPTNSEWSVVWTNCFLCNGYDSLCVCLTKFCDLTTIHWGASDDDTIFQAGSRFSYRKKVNSELKERTVYCVKNDRKWGFGQIGEPLPEEELSNYKEKNKPDRLNESSMVDLLGRLGVAPWDQEFYPLEKKKVFRLRRVNYPETIIQENFACIKNRVESQGT